MPWPERTRSSTSRSRGRAQPPAVARTTHTGRSASWSNGPDASRRAGLPSPPASAGIARGGAGMRAAGCERRIRCESPADHRRRTSYPAWEIDATNVSTNAPRAAALAATTAMDVAAVSASCCSPSAKWTGCLDDFPQRANRGRGRAAAPEPEVAVDGPAPPSPAVELVRRSPGGRRDRPLGAELGRGRGATGAPVTCESSGGAARDADGRPSPFA